VEADLVATFAPATTQTFIHKLASNTELGFENYFKKSSKKACEI
jgi:hypothetical protein